MKKINYNKEVRKKINELNENVEKVTGMTLDEYCLYFGNLIFKIDDDDYNNVFSKCLKMTAYTDLYTSYALKEKCRSLSAEEQEFFEFMKNLSSFDEVDEYFNLSSLFFSVALNELLNFSKSSVYSKILKFKCLDSIDIYNLTQINTFFYQDLENYIVNTDIKYILNKTKSSMNSADDFEKRDYILSETANYIYKLFLIDRVEAEKIILELIKNRIYLTNYLESLNDPYYDKIIKFHNVEFEYYKEIINNKKISEIQFSQIKKLIFDNYFYSNYKEEIDLAKLTLENESMIDNIKKYELQNKKGINKDV